jgi:hypothetical protein
MLAAVGLSLRSRDREVLTARVSAVVGIPTCIVRDIGALCEEMYADALMCQQFLTLTTGARIA